MMESLLLGWILVFATLATVSMNRLLGQYWSRIVVQGARSNSEAGVSISNSIEKHVENTPETQETHNEDDDEGKIEELKALKQLYYRLHNLEKFPEVLPQARRLLLSLLKETSAATEAVPDHESLLSVQSFSRPALAEFQSRRDKAIGKEWEHYNVRRKEGGPRELLGDRDEAIWWLQQISPVKYVDGAWLGHIGKVTTPFALQKTMKGAWQILSEELGDGDLEKNHAHLYRNLLETIVPGFPTAEALDFGHPRHRLDSLPVWKSAIAQLLISIFPVDFLPEILGFNLHFEAVSMDTLKAGKELSEVGIDPYYFILHVSIDNAHSGHTAIAMDVVCEYMDYIRRAEGEEALQKAWEKVQAGYHLSLGLPGTTVCPSRRRPRDDSSVFLNPGEKEVIRIFKAKAQVVHGIHCSCRARIGPRSVADWLDPVALESKKWQKGLLDGLSNSKYWICRGNSSKSRFIRELGWNGRMFGSFTQDECDILREWVDNLASTSLAPEETDAQQDTEDDVLSGYPVFQPSFSSKFTGTLTYQHSAMTSFSFKTLPPMDIGNSPIFESFLALWLSHPCLLQAFVAVPIRTTNNFACTIIKILRAQGGFHIERECVAGMGEVRNPSSLGLPGIGMNMMVQYGLSLTALPALKHVLRAWPSEFAVLMLHISMRPMEYKGWLVGMATAFAKMHLAIVEVELRLLSAEDKLTLQKIAWRELEGLELCWNEIMLDEKVYAECCKGYLSARHEIKRCFQS